MSRRLISFVLLSSSAALSALLQGCGGGGEAGAPAATAATAMNTATVRIDGCVVDEHYIPNQGVSVRALSADGRTLGYATSGRAGEFVLHLPARAQMALAVDREGGEWMSVPAQDRDKVVEFCLIARNGV